MYTSSEHDLEILKDSGVYVRGTQPKQRVFAGEPMFKTQRLLGARALVTDTFSQVGDDDRLLRPGKARYAHVEGYNVLWGDWRASWYGDPQKRIMWFATLGTTTSSWGLSLQTSLQVNGIGNYELAGSGYDTTVSKPYDCAVNIWHLFDTSAGIDLGADLP